MFPFAAFCSALLLPRARHRQDNEVPLARWPNTQLKLANVSFLKAPGQRPRRALSNPSDRGTSRGSGATETDEKYNREKQRERDETVAIVCPRPHAAFTSAAYTLVRISSCLFAIFVPRFFAACRIPFIQLRGTMLCRRDKKKAERK